MSAAQPIWKVTLADGSTRYRARVDIAPDPATGKRRQQRATFTNKSEAKAWVKRVGADVERGVHIERTARTLGEHLTAWVDGRLNIRPSTRSGYRLALAPYVDNIGAVSLQALKRQHIEGVRDRLLTGELRRVGIRGGPARVGGAPLAPRTVRMGLGLLQQALDDAERDGLVARNVARHVERPGGAGQPGAAWSAEQAQAFRTVAIGDRLAGAWALTLLGLRRGEVLGCRWSDLHLDDRAPTVSISATRVYVAGEVLDGTPKTARGVRVLPLPGWVVEALLTTKAAQAGEREAAGAAYAGGLHVATDQLGQPLRPERYSDAFSRLAREADVPVIRLHDARHTSVTLMRATGVPDPVVAAWHGHSEAVMRATYTHVSVEDMRAHAEAMR